MNGYIAYYRVAVGPLEGQGCERSELPCLGYAERKQCRRYWSVSV